MTEQGTSSAMRRFHVDPWALVAMVVVILCDQLTKLLMLDLLQEGESIVVIPNFFHLTLHFNLGAAFGLFAGLADGTREVVLAIAKLVALTAIFFFLFQEEFRTRRAQIALFMVLGGALGNIIDRLRIGKVVDFFDVYAIDRAYTWPTFNVADSAICIGVALILFLPRRGPSPTP